MPVYAISNGLVVYAADAGRGWNGVVIIKHWLSPYSSPVTSLYGHLDLNKINVTKGNIVKKGDLLGVIGPTPSGSTAPHLHFEIRTNDNILPGPGYLTNNNGWTDPSDYINSNRYNELPSPILSYYFNKDTLEKWTPKGFYKFQLTTPNQNGWLELIPENDPQLLSPYLFLSVNPKNEDGNDTPEEAIDIIQFSVIPVMPCNPVIA